MNIIEKMFVKSWDDGSSLQISFTTFGQPIILKNFGMSDKYKDEINKLADVFYLKNLDDDNVRKVLKEESFEEHPLSD